MTTTNSEKAHARNLQATEADGVKCELDGVYVHAIEPYLKVAHPQVTLEEYQSKFPDAPLHSETLLAARSRNAEKKLTMASAVVVPINPTTTKRSPFSDVFGLGKAPAALNKRGEPIMIDVLGDADPDIRGYVPAVDDRYVFDIDLLKKVMMAFEMKMPLLLWGMHGTGKTTIAEQYCAHTNRPCIRVQHTISTEEAHILGQYVLAPGQTIFNPGPLAYAMRYGLTYIADEYDFALPAVTSVYQPVLEGKDLIIKEATPDWRRVHPHPNFRFVATGNTNGAGDETGLYQGTQMQNAANYSRFGITVEVGYMKDELETAVVESQGMIHKEDAANLVRVANLIRDSYKRGDIGVTVSPREMIRTAIIGRVLGGDWREALALAYTNRLNTIDRDAVDGLIKRVFAS